METDLFKNACEPAVSKLGNCLEMYSSAQATAQYVHSMQVAVSGRSHSTHRRSSLPARLHSAGLRVRKELQHEENSNSLKTSLSKPIYKGRGKDPLETSSFGGVAPSSTIGRLLEYIILEHMKRQNGTRCRDGVKVLWCHFHLVWLFILGFHFYMQLFSFRKLFCDFVTYGSAKSVVTWSPHTIQVTIWVPHRQTELFQQTHEYIQENIQVHLM